MAKKSDKNEIKKEFDDFASKIAQLESIRHELDSLDTRGFETEVKLIRASLKDVNAIPQLRRELNSLREKIKHHHAKKSVKNSVSKKLLEKSKSIESDQEKLKKKISELANQLENKRKVSCKRQLSTKEVDFVKDIPKVESQLREIREDFRAHTKSAKTKVDSGVGVLVDTKFDDFVNEIKGELSTRIKAKESAMQAQLNVDLQEHEKMFAERYRDLVNEFHKKYKEKVDNELKREIRVNFEEKLRESLDKERKVLVDKLISENAQRLSAEKKRIVDELSNEYMSKEKMLEGKISSEKKALEGKLDSEKKELEGKIKLERAQLKQSFLRSILGLRHKEEVLSEKVRKEDKELRNQYSEKKAELQKRLDSLELRSRSLGVKEKDVEVELSNKRKQLSAEFASLKAEEKRAIEQNNQKADALIRQRKEELNEEFNRKIAEEKGKFHDEAVEKIQEAKRKGAEEVEIAVSLREAELRKSFENEYREKLKRELAVRNAQIEKKKAELEQRILSQARRMFH